MNCFYHSEQPAVAQCSVCKKRIVSFVYSNAEYCSIQRMLGKRRTELQNEINYYKGREEKQKRKMLILAAVFLLLIHLQEFHMVGVF